jgi:hypothetical protein
MRWDRRSAIVECRHTDSVLMCRQLAPFCRYFFDFVCSAAVLGFEKLSHSVSFASVPG